MATAAELQALKNQISSVLNLSATQALLRLNSNTVERAFEAYVFSLCCEAVRQAGGTVELRGINSGANPSTVVFRGGPGDMASTSQNYVYANCSLKSRSFEIHCDVTYEGKSQATHEIDVSICDARHANQVRTSRGMPKATSRGLIMAFECKYYESTPGVSLGRTFVGLLSDCGTLRLAGFLSNIGSPGLRRFFSLNRRPEPFFEVTPLGQNNRNRFVNTVAQALVKWAAE